MSEPLDPAILARLSVKPPPMRTLTAWPPRTPDRLKHLCDEIAALKREITEKDAIIFQLRQVIRESRP